MRIRVNAIILAGCFLLLTAVANAQDKAAAENASQASSSTPVQQGGKPNKDLGLGPVAESIRPYRATNRDPFRRTVKPKGQKAKSLQPRNMGFPALEVRRAEFRQRVQQAVAADKAEPDPVSQYLVNEIDIMGVFRDDKGFGAFVRAQPTGTTFFVRGGSRLYNGEVLRITGDEGDGSARVQFREVSYSEANGKQTPQDRVVVKTPAAAKR
jgi:hypothetical protein